MKEINIISGKELIDKFIETLRTDFEANLSWLDRSYPAVKIGKRENGSLYPQCYMQNGTFESIDLQPDNSVKSYCFFEKNKSSFTAPEIEEIGTYQLAVIFWVNLKAFNLATFDYTEQLVSDVIDRLYTHNCYDLFVNYTNPFDKYRIDVINNQYLMYPYTAFKLEFTRQLRVC